MEGMDGGATLWQHLVSFEMVSGQCEEPCCSWAAASQRPLMDDTTAREENVVSGRLMDLIHATRWRSAIICKAGIARILLYEVGEALGGIWSYLLCTSPLIMRGLS